jgi:hypothetical protein
MFHIIAKRGGEHWELDAVDARSAAKSVKEIVDAAWPEAPSRGLIIFIAILDLLIIVVSRAIVTLEERKKRGAHKPRIPGAHDDSRQSREGKDNAPPDDVGEQPASHSLRSPAGNDARASMPLSG